MILKHLNGDLIELTDISYPKKLFNPYSYLKKIASRIRPEISNVLEVFPEQVRLIPISSKDSKDNDVVQIDAYILVTFHRTLDLRSLAGQWDWSRMPIRFVFHIQNQSVMDHLSRIHKQGLMPKYVNDMVKCGRLKWVVRNTNLILLSSAQQRFIQIADHLESLEQLESDEERSNAFTALSLNESDTVVDWLSKNPDQIKYPVFLANANPHAVSKSIEWLQTGGYQKSPEEAMMWLQYNTNQDMFWWAWNHLPRPDEPFEILKWVSRVRDIEVVFNRDRSWL